MAFVIIIMGFLALGAACFPRLTWQATTAWKYAKPENVEPSTSYLVITSWATSQRGSP